MNAKLTYRIIVGAASISLVAAAPCPADWTLYPTDDSWLDQWSYDYCYGDHEKMGVRNKSTGGWESWSIFRFDLSSIPPGTNITSATVNLYYFHYWDNSPTGRPLTMYRVTADWNEETAIWANKPTHAATASASQKVPSSFQWMTWDVTADVQAFLDGQYDNYGWLLKDETYWGGANIPFIFFRTKEYGSYVPYLEVIPTPGTLALLAIGGLATGRRRR